MIWDRYGLLLEIEKYSFCYDKNPPRFGRVSDLRKWLTDTFGWCPSRLGTLEVLESVLWFLGSPDALAPRRPWCCSVEDAPSRLVNNRKISVSEMKRLRTEGETLQSIGVIAGISRERVRQLLKTI